MKRYYILLCALAAWGCSSLDFFSYRENTGLYAVEKPDGYGSAGFGSVIAATSTPDEDFMAVSAGAGERTIFYRLADENGLENLETVHQRYPTNPDVSEGRDPGERGSSADLAGLPLWSQNDGGEYTPLMGCMAIGEPAIGHVTVHCQSTPDAYYNIDTSGRLSRQFGQQLAAVRPSEAGGQWLLAAAGEQAFAVYPTQNIDDRSDPDGANEPASRPSDRIVELVAGRVQTPDAPDDPDDAGRSLIFVAVTIHNEDAGRYRILVYAQDPDHLQNFTPIACLSDQPSHGLGGFMATGDLTGNESDELLASPAKIEGRANEVYLFSVEEMMERYLNGDGEVAGGECESHYDGLEAQLAVLRPSEGEGVVCEDGCDFGTALAVGDIATDDSGPEVIIGAKNADVDGVSKAGAVFVYRGWRRGEAVQLASRVTDSTPKSGKAFGGQLAIAPMAGRNELLIGATNGGRVFVAFCTGVGEDIEDGADVTRNRDGKVVSTRCRP